MCYVFFRCCHYDSFVVSNFHLEYPEGYASETFAIISGVWMQENSDMLIIKKTTQTTTTNTQTQNQHSYEKVYDN